MKTWWENLRSWARTFGGFDIVFFAGGIHEKYHSCEGRNLTVSYRHNRQNMPIHSRPQINAADGDREGRCPLRFLPSQEWSTWGREIVGEYAVICMHDTVRFLPSQEWSGCVRGIVGEYDVVCRHDTVRFLLSQEWSAWGRGDCWRIWRLCGRRRRAATMPYLPIDSRSPVDHSCGIRNLIFTGGNAAH